MGVTEVVGKQVVNTFKGGIHYRRQMQEEGENKENRGHRGKRKGCV